MLTEDIDSSLRVLRGGGRIISDPGLISTELAPRHAAGAVEPADAVSQGWSQGAMQHLRAVLRSRELTVRQKLGCLQLLGWRELYPWLSLQTLTILAFWAMRGTPPVEWFVPVFVFTTLLTFSAGPVQAYTAWRRAHPSVKKHWGWFVFFGLVSQLAYVEGKNVIARTGHIKEAMRERRWKVTPRAVPEVRMPEPSAQPFAPAGGRRTANGSVTSRSREPKR